MKNLILITLDAFRKDAFGIYGNQRGLTPTFDSLRDKSLIFNKAQSTGPYTQASFPGILTSSYFLDFGQPKGLHPDRVLISEPLKRAGITTAAFHSNPYLCEYLGWNRGWDVFYDSMEDEVGEKVPYITGDIINVKALNWLKSYYDSDNSNPFFLWLHYMDVHEPYMPQRRYIEMVEPSVNIGQDQMYEIFESVLLNRDVTDPANVTLLKKLYDIHVREVDIYFEEFIGHLKNMELFDNTVIIVTNDHGDEFDEHGGLSHDDKLYSELIDMPLIIYGASERGNCDQVVSSVDIAPTILYLFGIEPVPEFKGHSLLPSSSYSQNGAYGEAIDQHSKKGGNLERDSYFFREQDIKIIYRANLDSWEMYNLQEDPKELTNMVENSPLAKGMKSKLKPMVRRWHNKI